MFGCLGWESAFVVVDGDEMGDVEVCEFAEGAAGGLSEAAACHSI